MNCQQVCPCSVQGTSLCSRYNGACVCAAGWTGTLCDGEGGGVMVREEGVMVREEGVMVREEGVMVREEGVMVREEGVMVREEGVMVREEGVMVREGE